GDMAIQLPRPSGPFGVGRTRFDWTDPNRQDRFHPSLKRRLVVWVWYPAHATGLNSPAAYVPGKWGESAARWSAITIRLHMSPNALRAFTTSAPVSPASIQHIRVHAVEDAPIADDRKNFPVLIFSPGLGQMPTDYTGLIEDLASHGYQPDLLYGRYRFCRRDRGRSHAGLEAQLERRGLLSDLARRLSFCDESDFEAEP